MRLLPRLFLSHAAVVLLTVAALFVMAELLAPAFIRHHVKEMTALIGPAGAGLQGDLSRGMRSTLTNALLLATGLALLVAALSAYLAARRVVRVVRQLSAGSQALAAGEYQRRLPEDGQDELSELARNFNTMARVLARTETSRIELITNVAHELRTPLTALQGYAEALNDEVLPPSHAASAILRETRAMERLASDLSLVSRVEAGQIELHHAAVPVAELLAAVGERFGALADDRGLTLTVRSVSPELRVWADPDRTGQVLANLISNAIKYTPRGGRVALEVVPAPDHVQMNVSDSGPGLNAAEQQRVFERFYRVDSSRSRAGGGGSGVGLTIARGLARAMGGELSVRAEPGQGSTFVLTLPIATLPTVR